MPLFLYTTGEKACEREPLKVRCDGKLCGEMRKRMTVKELVEKLAGYNQNAEVKVVAHNTMSDFDITFGTSEECEKETCDTVFIDSHLFQGESEKSS